MNIRLSALLAFFLFSSLPVLANPVKESYEAATEAFMAGEYERAIELYDETIKLNPKFPQPYFYKALAHKSISGDPYVVIEQLEKTLAIDPNFVQAHDMLGRIYYSLSDFDRSIEYARKASELDPQNTSTRLALAWTYLLGKSDTSNAMRYFKDVLKKGKSGYASFGLGIAYFMNGERLQVFDMITQLRAMQEEDMAVQLETMVRENRYIQPRNIGMPLAVPKEEKKPSAPVEPAMHHALTDPNGDMPVRLLTNPYPSTPSSRSSHQKSSSENPPNAQDRIKSLQQNWKSLDGQL